MNVMEKIERGEIPKHDIANVVLTHDDFAELLRLAKRGAAMKPDIESIRRKAEEVVKIKDTYLLAQKAGELIDPCLFDLLAYIDRLEAVAEAARERDKKLKEWRNPDNMFSERLFSTTHDLYAFDDQLSDALAKLDGDGK